MVTKKLLHILESMILLLATGIILLMIVSSLLLSWKPTIFNFSIVASTLLINLFLIHTSIVINNRSPRLFLVILILISFIIYIFWNKYAATVPVSDYEVILSGADKILDSSFREESFYKSSYFYFYNYQIGYTIYVAIIKAIFADSLFWLKTFEALYITLTSIAIYKIVDKISTSDAAAVAAVLYTLFLPNIFGASVINNQHISTLLICTSIYFLWKGTVKYAILSGSLLGLAQILRPAAIIVVVGVIIMHIFNALKGNEGTNWIKRCAAFIICFMLILRGFDMIVVSTGISPTPVSKSNAKYFKFVLGLKGEGVFGIPTEDARKTQVYYDLKTVDFDYDLYNKKCIEVISECITNYKGTLTFIKNKMFHFMGGKDNQLSFALNNINDYMYILIDAGNLQYIFLLACSFLLLFFRLLKGNIDIDLFCVLLIGYVLIHVFIETQTRYRYELYVFISIFAAQFVGQVKNKIVINIKSNQDYLKHN